MLDGIFTQKLEIFGIIFNKFSHITSIKIQASAKSNLLNINIWLKTQPNTHKIQPKIANHKILQVWNLAWTNAFVEKLALSSTYFENQIINPQVIAKQLDKLATIQTKKTSG